MSISSKAVKSTSQTNIKITGAFVDGKLQLSNTKSSDVDASKSFVAVNAPFDGCIVKK